MGTPAPFASFLVARVGSGLAATTRPAGGIGLPGGKVDPGETGSEAALREAAEEGWAIDAAPRELRLVHVARVDGRLVHWYEAPAGADPEALDHYKEKGRIRPVKASVEEVAASGFGNEWLVQTAAERIATARMAYYVAPKPPLRAQRWLDDNEISHEGRRRPPQWVVRAMQSYQGALEDARHEANERFMDSEEAEFFFG